MNVPTTTTANEQIKTLDHNISQQRNKMIDLQHRIRKLETTSDQVFIASNNAPDNHDYQSTLLTQQQQITTRIDTLETQILARD